jgi:hypothetical protein
MRTQPSTTPLSGASILFWRQTWIGKTSRPSAVANARYNTNELVLLVLSHPIFWAFKVVQVWRLLLH